LLNTIEWKNDEAIIFGKRIITSRKVAWYAEANFPYTYSNTINKHSMDKRIGWSLTDGRKGKWSKFNSCLLNLYHNGDEGMACTAMNEKQF